MSEREIRGILRSICDELDQHAGGLISKGVRKVLLPTAVGAGLALGGAAGCSDRSTPIPDATTSDSISQTDGGTKPDITKNPDMHQKLDINWPLPYMAPDCEPLHLQFARKA
jgi:hypothetical protein